MQNAAVGIALSAIAGSFAVLGAVLCVMLPVSQRTLAVCLAFAGGVMVTLSLGDLVPEALSSALSLFGHFEGTLAVLAAMLFGMAISLALDYILPQDDSGLMRLGLLSGVALMLHNLPEGAAVFAGAGADISKGASIAGAIALHNLPEGISIAMPVYAATKSRLKAIGAAFVSAVSEPLGAVIALIATGGKVSERSLCIIFSLAAGLMICLSFSELFPEAMSRSTKGAAFGALLGAGIMILGLAVF